MMERVALVTGGSSGIGLASARALQARGHKVSIVDINAETGQAIAISEGIHFVEADLSTQAGCKHAVDDTVQALGGLDILVNNAGFQHINPIPDFPEQTWDKLIALMLTAPFLLTKYAWAYLIRSGHGRVVHIGSAHSLTASPYKVGYVTAKHGLLGLMRVTALEGGEHGLTCNTVCPAYVRTPLVKKQIADQAKSRGIAESEVEEKVFLENVAIKKLLEPEDVGNYVAFLCSEEAWGITGSVQTMDLGWTAK
jgi:3-hydroxybutyrate dehydrogenase